jgi:hypothetical protein
MYLRYGSGFNVGHVITGEEMKVASKFQSALIGKNLYIQWCLSSAAEMIKSRSKE